MKIVIMNDLLVCGGAEMQSRREKELLESNGHEVYLLTYDYDFPRNHNFYKSDNGFFNIPIKNSGINKIKRKLFFDEILYSKTRAILKRLNPDIIHVNNLYLAPITQYKSLDGFNVVQTIRDYSAVCPLSTCIYKDYTICKGIKYNNCNLRCSSYKTPIKKYMYDTVYELRKKYVDKFICPSEKLTEYCKDHSYNIECINNPFDFSKLEKFKKAIDHNTKKYMYYGAINEEKGVFKLLEAFNKFSKNKNVKLIIAGKANKTSLDKLKLYLNNNKIEYLGFLSYDKIIKKLEEVYSVIVPSLWMENYPNTVLEGMCTECLVLGSNRGGIPDMLKDDKGIIFDVLDINDIVNALEKSYNIDIQQYKKIINKSKKYAIYNNSIEKYYERLINCFNDVIAYKKFNINKK
ncbi:MAG: glycosyltransferase [Thermoanaerobacterium thermosaccharolyticum]|jgi:glycosyltransferase involved in cell wall biosynthesis